MDGTTQENSLETLLQLGYQEDAQAGDKDTVTFLVFKQIENDTPIVIIAIYYHKPLTTSNANFIFSDGGKVMFKHLNTQDGTQDTVTRVAFILALSAGISSTMVTTYGLTSGLAKLADRKFKPTVLYSAEKSTTLNMLESIARLFRRGDNPKEVTFNAKSICHAHEQALQRAK